MKRILTTLVAIAGLATFSFAQSADEDVFYFDFIEDKLDDSEINEEYLKEHSLGLDVAKKLELLRESYTWTEPASATVPRDRTIVEKPAIYYALQKLDRHYKKLVKKGEMPLETAKQDLMEAIDIGLFIRYQQTADFETKLRELKEKEDIAMLFTEKVQLQY